MQDTTRAFWKDTAERFAWTLLQAAAAVFAAHEIGWLDLTGGELWQNVGTAVMAAGASFLKALAATALTSGKTAQLGTHTYSYTEPGPGSAGGSMEA